MREILFKAKRIDNGEWVEGDLSYIAHDKKRMYVFPADGLDSADRYEVYPTTLCQYTGLKDKNGRRIWENDIIYYQHDNDDCPFKNKDTRKRLGKVFFSEYRSSFSIAMGRNGSDIVNNDLYKYVQCGNRVKILGNIFDNSELLGQGGG